MIEGKANKNNPTRLPDELKAELRKAQAVYQSRGEEPPSFGTLLLTAWAGYNAGTPKALGPNVMENLQLPNPIPDITFGLAEIGKKIDSILDILGKHGEGYLDSAGVRPNSDERVAQLKAKTEKLRRSTGKPRRTGKRVRGRSENVVRPPKAGSNS